MGAGFTAALPPATIHVTQMNDRKEGWFMSWLEIVVLGFILAGVIGAACLVAFIAYLDKAIG